MVEWNWEEFKKMFPNLAREIEESSMTLQMKAIVTDKEVEQRLLSCVTRDEMLNEVERLYNEGVINREEYEVLKEAIELGLLAPAELEEGAPVDLIEKRESERRASGEESEECESGESTGGSH